MLTEEVGPCICAVCVCLQARTATGNLKERVAQYIQNQILEEFVSNAFSQTFITVYAILRYPFYMNK